MKVMERFLKYVAVDTESVEDAACFPSSEKQKNLARMLVEELKEIGAENPRMDEYGYVYATIPATSEKKVPVLGFLAHKDIIFIFYICLAETKVSSPANE